MTSEFSVAVHALIFLNHKGTVYSSEGLAANICTNPARIRKVMVKLKKAGLVETKEGIDGGYHFIGGSSETSLHKIAEALDFTFVSSGWKSGSTEMKCLIASGMGGIMEEVYEELNKECMKRLKEITIADLDKKIFKISENTRYER